MPTHTPFEQEVLSKLNQLTWDVSELKSDLSELKSDVSWLKWSVQRIETRLDRMDERFDNLDDKTDALWTLSNQSFSAISEIRSEVNPPWKASRSFSATR